MTKIKCAITGASGFVGSQIKEYLANKDLEIYTMGRKPGAGATQNHIPFVLGQDQAYPELSDIDVLIHCAYDFNVKSLQENEQINVMGSKHLFEEARRNGVKMIIFVSSMSAFPGVCSVYGQTKLKIEDWAQKSNAIVIRPGLIYNHNPQGIMGAMNNFVQKLPVVPLIGRGQQIFYPCHVDDLAELFYQLIRAKEVATKPIVAAAAQPLMFKEIVQILAMANGKRVLLLPLPYHFIYYGLRLVEALGLKLGLRSDSLVSIKHYVPEVDFARPASVETVVFRFMTPEVFKK